MNQLIAKVSRVPNARQLTALMTDLECVSAARKNTACLPARPDRHFILHAPALHLVPAVTNPMMDRRAKRVHFGFRKPPKLFESID
jgi:hypothetical protein